MIYFIGAGPGAVDLITVRGMELLKQASVVVYAGSLVNAELMRYCPKDVKALNSAGMTLEETTAVLAACPQEEVAVRLHTGDPSLYGAIREQMDALDALGLRYEIVPGVSSMSAAAAALRTEYTPAEISQTVIVTRMAGRTPVPEKENLRSLAAHGATMVLFLSAGMLAEVCRELEAGGYAADTPAAVVYRASWPDERIIRGTIDTLPQLAGDIRKTALIVVGECLGDHALRSLLYDPHFSHEYREAAR